MLDLTGKTALVTGASRGIGAATAKAFAEQGASVVLAARSSDAIKKIADEIVDAGGKSVAVACDVSDYSAVSGAVKVAVDTYGGLDILVNNAGTIEPIARLADSDQAQWGSAIDTNLKGVYNGLRAGIPEMLERGSGNIINISSGAATGVLEGWSAYCASKAAVLSLTRCTHLEYAEQGIRVVGLSPGTVATEMQVQIKASGINPVSQLDPSVHIPAEWPARAILWLCSEEAAEHAGTDFSLKTDENRKLVGLI